MNHRIRAAGLLVSDDRLLLVLERNEETGHEFWIPPGGGLEAPDGSVVACVKREFLEETGLQVEVGQLVYVREYVEPSRNTHHLELFFCVHDAQGQLHSLDRQTPPAGADLKRYARCFSREETRQLDVAPQELRESFWQDRGAGALQTRYLGANVEGEQAFS